MVSARIAGIGVSRQYPCIVHECMDKLVERFLLRLAVLGIAALGSHHEQVIRVLQLHFELMQNPRLYAVISRAQFREIEKPPIKWTRSTHF